MESLSGNLLSLIHLILRYIYSQKMTLNISNYNILLISFVHGNLYYFSHVKQKGIAAEVNLGTKIPKTVKVVIFSFFKR